MGGHQRIDSCRACKKDYEKYRFERFKGYVPSKCPKCGYHPKLEKDISDIINRGAKFEFQFPGRFSINAEELTDRITKELLQYWPKPKK